MHLSLYASISLVHVVFTGALVQSRGGDRLFPMVCIYLCNYLSMYLYRGGDRLFPMESMYLSMYV
jgi:hypothetical protein